MMTALLPAALAYPDIGPEIVSIDIGPITLALRWYALAYIAGFLIAWWLVLRMIHSPALWGQSGPPMSPEQPEQLLTWIIIGVILGGRLGYVLVYQPGYYLSNPVEIPMIWQGGMSFHGGFAGAVIAGCLFTRRNGLPALSVGDLMAASTPPGLFLGRVANFINNELWGRPSHAPWAVVFPGRAEETCPPDWVGACARHPSQLYEAGLEGLVLGLVIWVAIRRGALRRPGFVIGLFLGGYGLARVIVEHFRLADPQFITPDNPFGQVLRLGGGPDAWGLTMGQILSLPMLLAGIVLCLWAWRRGPTGAARGGRRGQ